MPTVAIALLLMLNLAAFSQSPNGKWACTKDARTTLTASRLRMQLSPSKETYEVGESPQLTILVTNIGDVTLSVLHQDVPVNYRVSVRGPSGNILVARHSVEEFPRFRVSCEAMAPGQHFADRFPLALQYNFDDPGTYQVSVEMDLYPEPHPKNEAPFGTLKAATSFQVK